MGPDGASSTSSTSGLTPSSEANPSTGAVTTVVGPPAIEDPRGVAISRDGFAYMGTFGPQRRLQGEPGDGRGGYGRRRSRGARGSSEVTLSADERTLWVANGQLGTEHLRGSITCRGGERAGPR